MAKIQPPLGGPATVHTLTTGGVTYELRLVCCGKTNCSKCNAHGRMRPTHGPYWYLCYSSRGRTCRAYLGKHLDTTRFRDPNGNISLALIRARRSLRDPVETANHDAPGQVDLADEAAIAEAPHQRSLVGRAFDRVFGPGDPGPLPLRRD